MKNNIKSIISFLLCLCMLAGGIFTIVAEVADDVVVEEATDEYDPWTVAVRPLIKIEEGKRITRAMLQEVVVLKESVPAGVVTDIAEVIGKYATKVLYPGDNIIAQHIRTSSKDENEEEEVVGDSQKGYLYITDYVKSGQEISDALQKVIDENPNRTIYFPDGVYYLKKPVLTSSDPTKSVSFRLTHKAVLQAANSWEGESGEALIKIGGANPEAKDSLEVGNSVFFTGGIVAGEGKTTGISVESGRDVLIYNVSFKKTKIGVHIKTNHVDVDNCVIAGANAGDTIGVLVEGSYNTVQNMRICDIHTGIKLTAPNNILRNLHPLYTPSTQSNESCGFWDESEGNFFDYCYSDQFAIAFRLADGNASVLNGCFAFWYSDATTRHWGIHAVGKFNALVRTTRIDMCDQGTNAINPDNAYLVVNEPGGFGKVLDPVSSGYSAYDNKFILNVVDSNDILRDYWVK